MSQPEKDKDPLSASRSQEQTSDREGARRKLNIVLGEDNPTDVFLVREALDHHNIDAALTCHRDGEQMLRYIDQIDAGEIPCPDVILLDLNLPRYSGRTVLERMRRSPLCADVPVVIVTSSKADDDRKSVFRLGATAYFHKSIDYDEAMSLGAIILDVTERRSSQ